MDSKQRRSTLATGSTVSGIPTSVSRPSAAQVRQSLAASNNNNRASLAPTRGLGASRASTAGNLGGGSGYPSGSQGSSQQFSQGHGGPPNPASMTAPGTASRNNNFYSSVGSMSVGRSGALRGSQLQQQQQAEIPYAPPSERRSSIYRRATTIGTATTPSGVSLINANKFTQKQDPRPNKQNKTRYTEEIECYLASKNYSGKALNPPTTPAVMSIFRFLIEKLDPGYRFTSGLNGVAKKPEDEVPPALRTVGYPFTDSITKSHLQAIGNSQTWHNLLAMLHWLVVMIENRELAFNNSPDLHMPAEFDEERPHTDAVVHSWMEYIGHSYPKFLATDNFEPDPELAQFYVQTDSGRRSILARVEELEQENEALKDELRELEDNPDPLQAALEKQAVMERDIEKFRKYVKEVTTKLANMKLQGQELLAYQQEVLQIRETGEATLKSLNAQFEAQGMTTVEVQQLSTEKTQLTSAILNITTKHRNLQELCGNTEVKLSRGFTKAEHLCAIYTTKAQALGLLPFGGPEGFEDINFEQEINGAKENPVMDCLTFIKPALVELRTRVKKEYAHTESESLELEEIITREKEAMGDLAEEAAVHLTTSKEAEAGLENMKETEKIETSAQNADIERLQTSVNHLSSTAGHNLATAEWRLEQRNLERDSVLVKTTDIRNQNRELLEAALDSIITYKGQMMKQTDILLELSDADF